MKEGVDFFERHCVERIYGKAGETPQELAQRLPPQDNGLWEIDYDPQLERYFARHNPHHNGQLVQTINSHYR